MMGCLFCKIVKGEIDYAKIYEDDDTLAFLDIHPIAKGHCLVIPKKHFENIFNIEESILQKVISAGKSISGKIKKSLGADGVNLINASGEAAEQTVFHFHLHIIPRFQNDGLKIHEWWQIKAINIAELKRLAEEIK